MAIILKTPYLQEVAGSIEPVEYVDSINKDSFVAEMYNLCIKYIRENTVETDNKVTTFKRENFSAKSENDIYYDKVDGFWMIANEKEKVITLFKRKTLVGRIYNSTLVEKIFKLECKECPKISPKVFVKTSVFDNFSKELSNRVADFRDRTDSLKK